jgi:hypothetical protein
MYYDKKFMKELYDDSEDYAEDICRRAKAQVKFKLRKWWSLVETFHDKSHYKEAVEKIIWYHLERAYIYYKGLVYDLKEWEKQEKNVTT